MTQNAFFEQNVVQYGSRGTDSPLPPSPHAGTQAASLRVIRRNLDTQAGSLRSDDMASVHTHMSARICYYQPFMTDFENAINELNLRLFEKIPSQSTDHDKQSLLAVELGVRKLASEYNYLEIGSYLGGSIQPHLLDPKCRRIYSIDKRPHSQPDARGFDFVYENNSTARMMEKLATVSENREKITTIDGDSKTIDAAEIKDKIQLCFIDGEHTDEAVIADFKLCLRVLDKCGAIIFHDAQITYNGIADCIAYLERNNIGFKAYALPNIVFVIEVGDFPLHKNDSIAERLIDNHHSYLFALQNNDHYRRFATRFPFGMLRRLMLKIRGGNVSE